MTQDIPGFAVSLVDVLAAARDFRGQAKRYGGAMPQGGYGCPRGGDNAIDRMMLVFLRTIGEAHSVLYEMVDSHGRKLEWAASEFEGHDQTISKILETMVHTSHDGRPTDPTQSALFKGVKVSAPATRFSGRLLGKLKSVQPKNVERVPVHCAYNAVGGDYPALHDLAQRLYGFGAASDRVVAALNGRVEDLVEDTGKYGHPGFAGYTSYAFQDSYEQDALSIFQLGEIAIRGADIINALACDLADIESTLEARLQGLAGSNVTVLHDGSWKVPTYSGPPNVTQLAAGNALIVAPPYGPVATKATNLVYDARARADEKRRSSASALAVLCDSASKMVNFYATAGGAGSQLDPAGTLGKERMTEFATQYRDLQAQFNKAMNGMKVKSGGQLAALAKKADAASNLADSATAISQNITSLKNSSQALKEGGFISKVKTLHESAGTAQSIYSTVAEALPFLLVLAE